MKAILNPIVRCVTIVHKANDVVHTRELFFKDLDEWGGFDIDGKEYDCHFIYDERVGFYVYDVTDNKEVWYNGQVDVDIDLILEYNDEDYNLAVSFNTLKLQGDE